MTIHAQYHFRDTDVPKIRTLDNKTIVIWFDSEGANAGDLYTDLAGLKKLHRAIGDYMISLEPDEPIHIHSDVAAPLEASDASN